MVKIAKAKVEDVLRLLAEESRVLEAKKDEHRIAARARGVTEAQIDELVPRHPAGSMAV